MTPDCTSVPVPSTTGSAAQAEPFQYSQRRLRDRAPAVSRRVSNAADQIVSPTEARTNPLSLTVPAGRSDGPGTLTLTVTSVDSPGSSVCRETVSVHGQTLPSVLKS